MKLSETYIKNRVIADEALKELQIEIVAEFLYLCRQDLKAMKWIAT